MKISLLNEVVQGIIDDLRESAFWEIKEAQWLTFCPILVALKEQPHD